MTMKRFTSDGWSITDGEHRIGMIQASKLLNQFHEENQQLKQEVEDLKQALIRCAFDGD